MGILFVFIYVKVKDNIILKELAFNLDKHYHIGQSEGSIDGGHGR